MVTRPDRRAQLGQWYTAAPVAELAIAALGGVTGMRVLDPTCGDGAFLAAAHGAGATALAGIEIDADAAAHARTRVPSARIVVGDVLAPGSGVAGQTFDVVVGNPPYVRAGRIDPAVKRARAAVLATDWPTLDGDVIDAIARHADVAATCLLRALHFVRPGGRLALVMSTALLDADGASALWTAVARIARVEALIAAPAERWFAEAAVNSMLLVARRHDGLPTTNASPRILRLTTPTREVVGSARTLEDIARFAEERATSPDPASRCAMASAPPTGRR